MIDKLKKAVQDTTSVVMDKANAVADSVRDKTMQIMEDWAKAFPKLETLGLTMTGYQINMGINPCLSAEFTGEHTAFSKDSIKAILAENKQNPVVLSVFGAMQSAYYLYDFMEHPLLDPLVVNVKVQLLPEVTVTFGTINA
ncbi:MAG: hypothetical protein ACOYNO_04685 [Saprospiraceae bacterium]